MKKTSQRGFTLIELLVVISIISLLSSIILAGLAGARIKALDAKRMAEIHSIDNAVQLYLTSNGHVPYLGSDFCQPNASLPFLTGARNCFAAIGTNNTAWIQFTAQIAPYMPKVPIDPCGYSADCTAKGLEYLYVAPLGVEYFCPDTTGVCSVANLMTQYQVSAKLQSTQNIVGVDTLGTFFTLPPNAY